MARRMANEADSTQRNVILLVTILLITLTSLGVLVSTAPKPTQPECTNVEPSHFLKCALPTVLGGFDNKLEKLRGLWQCADAYKAHNPGFALTAFASLYVTLQAFAIPGSVWLSLLAGTLYPRLFALILVVSCATVGASTCYLLSSVLGRPIIRKRFASGIARFQEHADANADNMMFFMMFLRLTPLVPNAFVNFASPIAGVPFSIFFIGTFFGLIPATLIHVNTGKTLRDAAVMPDGGWTQVAILFGLQFLALLPVFLKKRLAAAAEAKVQKAKQT